MPRTEHDLTDEADCFDGWSLHQLPDGGEAFVSPCQRVRLHFPAATAWEPSVTIAAYDTPTGHARWRARFEDSAPEEVIGFLLCAVAHDLAKPDRYDQQRALRGPALTDPADVLDNATCPGAAGTWCGCPRLFGLDLTGTRACVMS
ncbi:hypothetical protein GCM10010430_60770 [Kitasatospora cystarginea]|uniref:DUF317 domain-containing protein n=1 Tax=Kitasatospora cystarginea TaxID=58350 RepID=A0ABP5RRB2_9ACTN